jgi:outer membrane lipoprotein-sorting protein
MTPRLIFIACLLLPGLVAADSLEPLRVALEKRSEHQTVSVNVKQTKKIPALTQDIVIRGHLWLVPGRSFRWQLGDPLVQGAVYDGAKVHLADESGKTSVLDPDDRRVKPLLLMLGIGESASFDKIQQAFSADGVNVVDEHFIVNLVPKGQLQRVIRSMVMQINTRTSFPERIEWTQKDGTVIVTEFSPPVFDKKLPTDVFDAALTSYPWK